MTIIINVNEYDEYEVPTPSWDAPDSIYFTDDIYDAFDTARRHHGIQADIQFAYNDNELCDLSEVRDIIELLGENA